MRLAVLLHEEAPERVAVLLEQAGLLSVAPFVAAVIAGFGKLWKLRPVLFALEAARD